MMNKRCNFALVFRVIRNFLVREKSYIEERDEALYKAYVTALGQPDVKSHQQAIAVAISSPTSQFWIEPYRAYHEILWYSKGKRPFRISNNRRDLMNELYAKYLSLKDKPSFRGCSTFFISQFAVAMPASSFYMSYRSALRIITRKRNEKRRM